MFDLGVDIVIEIVLACTTFGAGNAIYRSAKLAKWMASFAAKLNKFPKLALKLNKLNRIPVISKSTKWL